MCRGGVIMKSCSLIFGFRDAVSGPGFLAGVAVEGRALMVQEGDGEWWMYGVQPGGLAAKGAGPAEAHAAFRDAYKKVLFDIAAFVPDYNAFRSEVDYFYADTDDEDAARWLDVARAIRAGDVAPDAPFFSDLPRKSAEELCCRVTVERLDAPQRQFNPADNVVDTAVVAEAA
jgi:hypothetical protein